jgi:HEAT repeat protein
MIKRMMELIVNAIKSKKIKEDNTINLQRTRNIQANWLNDNIELSAIPEIFQLLISGDEKVKLQAAEILNRVLSTLSSTQLIKLDILLREKVSYDWHRDWRNKSPEELLHPLMSKEEKVTILGLSSFHPNGYFREKAIRTLSSLETGGEIPYLLIRINDWVKQVRNTAKLQLLRYITQEHAMNFVNNLPLILRLRDCSRDEHIDIVDAVVSILSSAEGAQKLISGLQSTDSKVRLACYKIILETKVIDNRSVISCLIKDTNPYNRLFVLRNIRQGITQEEFADISQLLLHDKFAQIRIFVLEVLYDFMPEEAVGILEKSLFNSNQSVRELSRYVLSKEKKYDFAAIYRDSIEKNEKLYSAICGLGEKGDISDTEIIIKYMNSDVIRIVKACIIALAKLDIQGYKERIILMLKDERAGISRTARKVLHEKVDASDADTIYIIFKQAVHVHVKINCCVLLCTLSKWSAIRYIIEFCADENERVSTLGQMALERWKLRYNSSFTTPTSSQIKEIREALIYFWESVKERDRDFIEFCMRDFIR